MSAFTESVEHYLKGLDAVSAGACPGCEECGLGEGPTDEEYDLAQEANFVHGVMNPCDSCGSRFGGDRFPGHALMDNELIHLDICVDCLFYLANGNEPEEWQQYPGEVE